MAKRFRAVQRDQLFMFPPCPRDWLAADHPVWLVIRAVELMDTSAFAAARKVGGAGAAGYDPDMLLTVLVWAYAHGVTSSRRIEQLCGTDVAFKVICGQNLPDHVTFARFRAGFPAVVAAFFAEVLALCAGLGMGKLGVVALDGTKVTASASKSANRTEERLRKLAEETVAAHAAADAAEDDLFGAGRRGDEVPEDAWSPRSRDQRIKAGLASLRAEREAAEKAEQAKAATFRARRRAGQQPGPAPLSAAVALAEEKLARARAARAAQLARLEKRYAAGEPVRRPRQAGIDDYCRVVQAAAHLEQVKGRVAAAAARKNDKNKDRAGPGPVRNLTDPDSRLMPVRGGGFTQGYNAQNVVSEDGLIIATALTQDTGDTAWFTPMMDAAETAAQLITARRPATIPAAGPGPDAGDGGDDDDGAWRQAGYRPPVPDGQQPYAGGIGLALADAGYCSEANITAPGPPRLIATGKLRDLAKTARDGSDATPRPSQTIAAMAARLATSDGITAYRHRGHIAETPHGNIKHNHGFGQLSVRGLAKASAEWDFAASVHNLLKTITTGHLTHAALDKLAAHAGYPPSPHTA